VAASNGSTIDLSGGIDTTVVGGEITIPAGASGKVLIHVIIPFKYQGTNESAPQTNHTYFLLYGTGGPPGILAYEATVTLVPQDESDFYYDYFACTVPISGLSTSTVWAFEWSAKASTTLTYDSVLSGSAVITIEPVP
jgi:hypothetical protein